jgi:type IV pilus assembly protein PilW
MKYYTHNAYSCQCGYSLVEILVAMAIALVVLAGVFKVYVTHQDSYLLQEQVAEMQQNARTARYIMTKEIRMAGYDPMRTHKFGVITAGANSIRFTLDILPENADGTIGDGSITLPGDDITYSVSTDNELERDEGSGKLAVAESIQAIGFAYAFDADEDGNIETCDTDMKWAIDSDGDDLLDLNLDANGDCKIDVSDDANNDGFLDGTAIPPVPIANIRAVRIWLLAKTGQPDRNYTNSNTYVVGQRIVQNNDQTRRYLVTTTIKCRNMGI